MPVRVQGDKRGTLYVEFQDCLKMVVQVSECHLLGVHSVNSECLSDAAIFLCPCQPLTLGALSWIEAIKDAHLWLFLDLAGKFCDELAQWSKFLAFVTEQLDKCLSICHQA